MKKRILVVDDELSIRMLLDNFLSDDYTVFTKDNGYEAMSWFKEGNTADLILVDIVMNSLRAYENKPECKQYPSLCYPANRRVKIE